MDTVRPAAVHPWPVVERCQVKKKADTMRVDKTLKASIAGIVIVVTAVGGFGGYRLYQRHYLSSEIRRTLTAANGPGCNRG